MMGTREPTNRPTNTSGFLMLITSNPATCVKAVKRAKAVSAADPVAKLLPMAVVVCPMAPRLAVIFLVSRSKPDISDMPPVLSAIGPQE